MNLSNRYTAALALTGCVVALSAYLGRQRTRRENAQELRNALERWENEGGIVVPPKANPASAS